MNPNPLGRIQRHDPQSRDYAVRAAPMIGKSVRHRMGAPNVDQFYTSGCVGFAGTNALNCAAAVRSRRQFNAWFQERARMRWPISAYCDNQAGLMNYSESTYRDPFDWQYPPTDNGSSAIGLMKFWREIGVINGYRWCFTFDQFLAALQRQPVLVGTDWYEGMTYPDDRGVGWNHGQHQGGHEYLATGISWANQLIRCENSWGEGWGFHRGAFYLPFSVIEQLLGEGGDAVAPEFL